MSAGILEPVMCFIVIVPFSTCSRRKWAFYQHVLTEQLGHLIVTWKSQIYFRLREFYVGGLVFLFFY